MPLNITQLGQVFTPADVTQLMLDLCKNNGRFLEPSAGEGAFFIPLRNRGANVVGIEIDPAVAPHGAIIGDFFSYPEHEQFDSIIGNPPYVRYQDIAPETRKRLPMSLFDTRANLFLFFIEKAVRHLRPGGELIFIVPRDLIKLTAAKRLNAWLYQQGSFTHFIETGDAKVFKGATPNCCIFRFEKGRMDRALEDGRVFLEKSGQLLFLRKDYPVDLADLFEVRVGGASGADHLFSSPAGNREFVCSKTVTTGETRRMFYGIDHPALEQHKTSLLARKIKRFDETNWWHWGRGFPEDARPRIYVNGKTRNPKPFFMHDCTAFDGSILALFPRFKTSDRMLARLTQMLNEDVDWEDLGFVCDGRLLFTQRSLQNSPLPSMFEQARLTTPESV